MASDQLLMSAFSLSVAIRSEQHSVLGSWLKATIPQPAGGVCSTGGNETK